MELGRRTNEQRIVVDVWRIDRAGVVLLAFEPRTGQALGRAHEQHGTERRIDDRLRRRSALDGFGGMTHFRFSRLFHSFSTAYERHGRQAWASASAPRCEG